MSQNEFVQVGKVKDAHGIRGELFVVLFSGEAEWVDRLETLRLVPAESSSDGAKTFTVKSVRAHKNGLIAKTEEIKDRNEAETLKGWLLEIPEEFLISEPGETIYLREIQNFSVITKHKGPIGQIVNFATNGHQDLLVVKTSWGEFEIPLVEQFVEKIDYEAGEIHMDIPEGLLGELDGDESQ
jgi:16S rRNA processing protein RimM